MELALKELLASGGSSAKRHTKELIRPASLHVLLVEKVEQQVLVALNQALRVNLPML